MAGQAFNVGGGPRNTLSLNELVQKLERAFGRRFGVPYAAGRPGDQRVFIANVSKARKLLGWEPTTPIDEGVDRMLGWIRKNIGLFQ